MKQTLKIRNQIVRKHRVRAKIHGNADRPRLSVVISNTNVSCQIIDDDRGVTLVSATTVGKNLKVNMTEKAILIGQEIAKNAKQSKIISVVFDRNGHRYHGRIKALAEAAREGGLKI